MWRSVNYGVLRKKKLYEKAEKLYHRHNINLRFWRKILDGVYHYGIRREPLLGVLTAKFYLPDNEVALVEFSTVTELFEKMADTGIEYESGYDCDQLMEADPDMSHFYLDMSSQDDCKRKPAPSHVREMKDKDNAKWEVIPDRRRQAEEKFLTDEERDFFSQCHNTFEIHGMQADPNSPDPAVQEVLRLQKEKYQLLQKAHTYGHYKTSDHTFLRFVVYEILEEMEADSNGNIKDIFVRFDYSEMLLMGCHNSSKGGMGYAAKKGEVKSTTAVLATLEACSLFKEAAETGQCTIRPHTMNCKEERNKPGKKEKMFIQLDHCLQIISYLFYGNSTDKKRQKVQSGYLMGASLNGQVIDELLRLQLGLATAKGKMSDEDLRTLRLIQSDFKGFEIHPDKNVFLTIAWAKMMVYGGGVMDHLGHPNRMLKIVLAAFFERKLAPDIRCGGNNTCWKTPGIQISGEPDTLANNQENHKGMVLMAQFEHEEFLLNSGREKEAYLPENSGKIEGAPKNGDDGMYSDEPYVREVLAKLEAHEPVQFTQEKIGSFLSVIKDGQLINDAISFCKSNFVLEEIDGRATITLQRTFQNMHKCVKGNRSTYDPQVAIASVISQTTNVYGNDRYYKLLEYLYNEWTAVFGKLGRVKEEDNRDQTAIDSSFKFDYFPTQEEVRAVLYNRDPYKIAELQRSMLRHYQYGVPATGVGKF